MLPPITIKNVFNAADILTKSQDAQTIQNVMELLDHRFESGRSLIAPQMNMLDDHNGAVTFLLHHIGADVDVV